MQINAMRKELRSGIARTKTETEESPGDLGKQLMQLALREERVNTLAVEYGRGNLRITFQKELSAKLRSKMLEMAARLGIELEILD